MIDRRAFPRRLGFGTISAAAAVCTFDVDKLLWVPGEKTIVLPALERYGGRNTLITPTWIIREGAAVYQEAMAVIPSAYFITR